MGGVVCECLRCIFDFCGEAEPTSTEVTCCFEPVEAQPDPIRFANSIGTDQSFGDPILLVVVRCYMRNATAIPPEMLIEVPPW